MRDFYKNKTILITGASSGIGKDLALYLSCFETNLILVARRYDLLVDLEKQCQKLGANVLIAKADVTDFKAMERLCYQSLEQFNFVDIVIANAGIGGLNPAYNFSLEINHQCMSVNYFGLVNTFIPYIKSMKEAGKGHLVGVSSLASFRGLPKAASYSSAKAAQARLLESFRVDLKSFGITVSAIYPGFVESQMTNHDDFKMPFKLPVRTSSHLVARAIKNKKSEYLYPWQMKYLTILNKMLPNCIYDLLIPSLSGIKDDIEAKSL